MQPEPAAGLDRHLIEEFTGRSELLHQGWLEMRRDEVRLPDGTTATREYVRHSGAVAIVPVLDDGRLVLVRQYRYPLRSVLLEFPAGKLEPGEPQLTCAIRELQEETGYTAAEWAYGGEIHNAPAYSDESIWIWFARGLQPGAARPDAGEFVETLLMGVEELQALADAGELPDVKTQIGLNWLQRGLAGQRAWHWQERP
jgi:ADP-ribose pyrophosphatase